MLRRALSLSFWAFMLASSLLIFPVAVIVWLATYAFDRRLVALHLLTCFWGSLYSWLNPLWRVRIEGREKLRANETYVIVANHQSLLDILVLFRLFAHFKWVSKIENFRIPLIGWNMLLNRYIPLIRGSRESTARMLEACERTLADGSSIMMFPEGTRSPDGRLRAFKPGAFQVARNARRPLLPIVVEGTAEALPKRGFILQGRHEIRLKLLDEIPYAVFAGLDAGEISTLVRERIAAELGGEPAPVLLIQAPADSCFAWSSPSSRTYMARMLAQSSSTGVSANEA